LLYRDSKKNDTSQGPTIAFLGDVAIHGKVQKIIKKGNEDKVFGEIKNILQSHDLTIFNLETPLCSCDSPIIKSGPNLKGDPTCAQFLRRVGLNVACLANNHCMDYGVDGLKETIEACHNASIKTVGAGRNADEAYRPLVFDIKNVKTAILNVAEGEEAKSVLGKGGAADAFSCRSIENLRKVRKEMDVVIVVAHAGCEYLQIPAPYVIDLYRRFADEGADLVVGHHPHVPQGIEYYNGTLIAYSLGNFLFDFGRKSYGIPLLYQGLILITEFDGDKLFRATVCPGSFDPRLERLLLMKGDEKKAFLKDIKRISAFLSNSDYYQERWNDHCRLRLREATPGIIGALIAISPNLSEFGKILIEGIITSVMKRKNRRKAAAYLKNNIKTHAHLDRILTALDEIIEQRNDY